MLNFVPGGSAYHQNYMRYHCQQLAKHNQHTEISAYPFVPGPKQQLRAKHVGYGLKFYALAPAARAVLKQHIFQITAWEMEIFKTVASNVAVRGQWGNHDAVGCLLPGVGEHTRDFKDFHLGSGRFRTDRGHEGGPYVFVDIISETELGQRIHMLAVGLDIARIGKVGCVWTWPASWSVPCDFHDIFRISEDAKTSGIAFTLVITDKMDSGTKKYYRDLRAERMATINDDVCYMEFMASLQSEAWPMDENMDWLAGAGADPTSKWI